MSVTPPPQGGVAQRCPILGVLQFCLDTLYCRTTMFVKVTCGECFSGSATPPIPKGMCCSIPKFLGQKCCCGNCRNLWGHVSWGQPHLPSQGGKVWWFSRLLVHGLTYSDQIWHIWHFNTACFTGPATPLHIAQMCHAVYQR